MTRRWRLSLGVVVSGLALVGAARPSAAHAQDPSFMPLPVGDEALGVGGAFTAVSSDGSAIWYDPGGLALLGSASVSASLSVTVSDSFDVDRGYAAGGRTAPLSDEGSPNVPFFVGVVGKVGSEPDPRDRQHALSLAIVRPTRTGRRFSLALPADGAGSTATLRTREDDSEELYGAAYAYRVAPNLGIGASIFLHLRNFTHAEDEVIASQGTRGPDGTFMGSSLEARSSTASLSAASILFRVGALYQVDRHLRLGLTFQPPNIPITASGRVAEHVATASLATSSATFYDADQDLDGSWPLPWELRLGVAWQPDDLLRLSLDASLLGPLGSATDPVRPFGQPVSPAGGARAPVAGRFVAESFQTDLTPNFAIGGETVIADIVPIRLGFFTALSPLPRLEGAATAPRAAHVDSLGATLVVGYRNDGFDVAVGTAFVYGWGKVDAPDAAGGGWTPANVQSHALFLFVTGYSSAAKRLAEEVYREVLASPEELERRAREEAERARLVRLREECERRLREEHEEHEEQSEPTPDAETAPPPPHAGSPVDPPIAPDGPAED